MSTAVLTVNLALTALETLLYGIYLVLFVLSMYFLVQRENTAHANGSRPRSPVRYLGFSFSVLLFVAVTGHWATTTSRIFFGFTQFQEDLGGINIADFFNNPSHPTRTVQSWFLTASVLFGEALIIHRLWVVWMRTTGVIVFPVCCLVTSTIGNILSVTFLTHNHDVYADKWLSINAYIILANNVYCTGLIGWKIWSVTRISEVSKGSTSRSFGVIIVESAAIFASWTVLFALTLYFKCDVQLVVIETTPTVIGVVNALIQTRVGLGLTQENIGTVGGAVTPLRFHMSGFAAMMVERVSSATCGGRPAGGANRISSVNTAMVNRRSGIYGEDKVKDLDRSKGRRNSLPPDQSWMNFTGWILSDSMTMGENRGERLDGIFWTMCERDPAYYREGFRREHPRGKLKAAHMADEAR
ncbi:hypothetical protein B0H17DRAFT_1146351 [Mycena rosella]|uniref:Uncharacterized protein n=1 Tax=Mycena rosella TaxID=1033263 RepID=A0AAD7CP66_MYCRO|nr:hypothetical protein B0H17DRAFT_1146351 [Mycena rosella]